MNADSRGTGKQTRNLLLIGFGGLLALLAFTGLNALSVLKRIETRNERIRDDYVNRDRILEQLRSDIFLSGTYVRDLLLEPDAAQAQVHRAEFDGAHQRIESMIAAYRAILRTEESGSFDQFSKEVAAYFDSMRPALSWNAEQRRSLGYEFMKNSLLPRRMVIVHLADRIGHLNERQMIAGNRQVTDLFASFRRVFTVLLILSFSCGLVLAAASVARVLRLERLSMRRYNEVVEARSALRDLSARLVEAQETERRALSRELHDEVGQALSALLLAIGNVAAVIPEEQNPEARSQLQDTRRLAEKTVSVVRDMSLLLRPSMLDDLGLLPALEWQAREVSRNRSLAVTVEADSVPDDLPDEQRTCIYRVVQEALRNSTRHARARHVQIKLSLTDDYLRLSIHDDGVGFEPGRQKGLGLLGMEERVKHLSGSFRIDSQRRQGTTIEVDLPRSA